MRTRCLLLPALLLAAACGAKDLREDPAPLDRFTWPTGLAALDGKLIVVSSNFDLRYAADDGGSVIALTPPAASDPQSSLGQVLGTERIASLAGPLAIASAADPTCGLASTEAILAARATNTLYRLTVDAATGALACGAGCTTGLGGDRTDAYAVAVTCVSGRAPSAWIGFLRGPSLQPWLERLDLSAAGTKPEIVQLGTSGPVRTLAYDAVTDRLFAGVQTSVTTAPLAWIDLAGGSCDVTTVATEGGCHTGAIDLGGLVRGADIVSIALSSPGQPRRLYAGLRRFDPVLAASVGFRPGTDVDGVLAVFDLSENVLGGPKLTLRDVVSVGLGVGEIAVVPRPGLGDLVAVTAIDEETVALYDVEQQSLAVPLFGRDATTGVPLFGRRPFGLAVQPGATEARVYVASFDQAFVTPLVVPLAQPWLAAPETLTVGTSQQIRRIGSAR